MAGPTSLNDCIGIAVVVGILGGLVWMKTAHPYLAEVNGAQLLPIVKTDIKGIRHEKEEDARVHENLRLGNDLHLVLPPLVVRDDTVYVDDKGARAGAWTGGEWSSTTDATGWHGTTHLPDGTEVHLDRDQTRNRYLANPFSDRLDLGTYAGYLRSHDRNIRPFDVGVRIGFLGLLDDSIRLDGVVSGQAAGLGVSFHLPPDLAPGFLRHLGIGVYRTVDFDQHGYGSTVALSFSTR